MEIQPRVIGHLWETPVLVRGRTWFPVTQIGTFALMLWLDRNRSPDRPAHRHLAFAAMSSIVILGSEWAHNLAHLTAAHLIQKPMDEFHILLGMPRCVYLDLNDPEVQPRQHIQRSLAGPLFNVALLPIIIRMYQNSTPGSLAHDIWSTALHMNVFLSTVSLLPIPGIDGAPVLKWSLVAREYSIEQADETVRKINGPLALILGLAAFVAGLKRKRFLSLLLTALAGTALGVFSGMIKETEILQSSNSRRARL